jgi:hypothetical protein
MIPVPPEWQHSLQIDFATYSGNAVDPVDDPFDPSKWHFLKSGADATQMLYAQPLTNTQMNELAFNFTSVNEKQHAKPTVFFLEQNYPNPFNPKTVIRYQLSAVSDVQLSIYNTLGEKVADLVSKKQAAGFYTVEWEAGNLPSGIYYYHLKAGNFQDVKKMMLLK